MATNEVNTMIFEKFRPVATKRASEVIYEQVRSLILKGELNPGDRLPSERNMMEMFQRSRPIIREALRTLEHAGYIHTIAGSNGAIVREPGNEKLQQTMEDILQVGHIGLKEMSEYRKISETATVTWAAQRNTSEDIAALQDILKRMKDCIGNYEKFIELDPQFHRLLAIAAQNQVCIVMNETFSKLNCSFVMNKMNTLTSAGRKKMCIKVNEMHEAIFLAVQSRDEEKARQAMEVHLRAFESDLS
jgi:GntR family transcriptional repressor for pyruvate dehydrogenase complex